MPRHTPDHLLAGEPARIIDAAARRVARQLYHTGLTAEDARQSLVEALLTRQAEWRDVEHFPSRVQELVNGFAVDLIRHAHRERRHADITDLAEMEISDGEPGIEVQAAVQRALDRLPPDRAAVVVLVISGHGTEEAAALRGTTRKAVRVALDHFRRLYDGEAEEK
jgi:DNA-directed RNA polymerase specialized sigma24 family protein